MEGSGWFLKLTQVLVFFTNIFHVFFSVTSRCILAMFPSEKYQHRRVSAFQYSVIKLEESEIPFSRCAASFIMLNNDTKNVQKF